MSMAVKYGMQKRKKMAKGGEASAPSTPCKGCEAGSCTEHGAMVDKIMAKRYSKGGRVANDTPPIVDDMDADYDVLANDDDLHFSETGDNSGDKLGNKAMDKRDDDLVARIMRSRSKKDRMPRPA